MKRIFEPIEEECDLTHFGFFKSLSSREMEQVNYEKSCMFLPKGTTIYKEGDKLGGFYCIIKGVVKLVKKGLDDKEQILRFGHEGGLIGYRSLLGKAKASNTAKVIDDTIVCYLPGKILRQLITNNSSFAKELIHLVCSELDQSNSWMVNIIQKSVKERVAEILLMLKREFGVDEVGNINVVLTRGEIGCMVGTATESIIRLLSEFKQKELIDISGKKIKILNEYGLAEVARLSVEYA